MPRRSLAQPSPTLDAYEVEVVEKSVFGMTAAEEARRRAEEERAAEEAAAQEAFEVPEADRLFDRPTADEAARALRELEWGEHIVGMRIAAARGNTTAYLYSLEEAATFFLDEKSGSASLGTNGAFAWIDTEAFVAWLRDVVGDRAFADVLEDRLAGLDAYNDKVEALRTLFMLRMSQYAPYLRGAHEQAERDE